MWWHTEDRHSVHEVGRTGREQLHRLWKQSHREVSAIWDDRGCNTGRDCTDGYLCTEKPQPQIDDTDPSSGNVTITNDFFCFSSIPLKMLCQNMKRQIVSRAFYGCKHTLFTRLFRVSSVEPCICSTWTETFNVGLISMKQFHIFNMFVM